MTVGEMLGLTNRFKAIINSYSCSKNERLANLMTDMETAYNIPIFRDENFEKTNPFVMSMYRTISDARNFERVSVHDRNSCCTSQIG